MTTAMTQLANELGPPQRAGSLVATAVLLGCLFTPRFYCTLQAAAYSSVAGASAQRRNPRRLQSSVHGQAARLGAEDDALVHGQCLDRRHSAADTLQLVHLGRLCNVFLRPWAAQQGWWAVLHASCSSTPDGPSTRTCFP